MGRTSARRLMDEFDSTVSDMLAEGVADTDQSVFTLMARRDPHLFDFYPAIKDWFNIVKGYMGQDFQKGKQ
jgi:hypothetical protein